MAQWLTPLIYVLAFIAMVMAVQGVAGVVFSARDKAQRTNRRLTMLASGMQRTDVYSALVRQPMQRPGQNFLPAGIYDGFARYWRQAGLEGSPLRSLLFVGAASGVLWLISLALIREVSFARIVLNAAFALPASLTICVFFFWIWLGRKRTKRLKQLEEQMPLALDVVIRAIRAGHPVVSAVHLAGDEMGDPIGSEFGLIVDETTYGFEFREALMNFARRTGSADAHFFAVSVGVQSETGGNLAEILDGLSAVIRNRSMLGKRVRALSSEGRASAALLTALPLLMVSFLMLTNPAYYTSKFADPAFWPTVGTVGLAYLLGIFMIHRIINFRY
jgi:tight adherence protein B